MVAGDLHAHRRDALDLLHQPVARQAVGGDAVVHHAAGLGHRVADLDLVPEAAQMVGAGEAGRPGADHQHAPAGRRAGGNAPALARGHVAEEAVDGVDRHRRVELGAVAGGLAGVVAGAPVRRRQRVLLHVLEPGLAVAPGLRLGQPGLDVLARRAGVVARRHQVAVDRPLPADRSRAAQRGRLQHGGEVFRDQAHGSYLYAQPLASVPRFSARDLILVSFSAPPGFFAM